MTRGDMVTVALQGDNGKLRPAVVIQSDRLAGTDGILVCLLTSVQKHTPIYRLPVEPSGHNRLRRVSEIMVEKIMAVPRAKVGVVFGSADEATMLALNQMLAIVIGLVAEPVVALSGGHELGSRTS